MFAIQVLLLEGLYFDPSYSYGGYIEGSSKVTGTSLVRKSQVRTGKTTGTVSSKNNSSPRTPSIESYRGGMLIRTHVLFCTANTTRHLERYSGFESDRLVAVTRKNFGRIPGGKFLKGSALQNGALFHSRRSSCNDFWHVIHLTKRALVVYGARTGWKNWGGITRSGCANGENKIFQLAAAKWMKQHFLKEQNFLWRFTARIRLVFFRFRWAHTNNWSP